MHRSHEAGGTEQEPVEERRVDPGDVVQRVHQGSGTEEDV